MGTPEAKPFAVPPGGRKGRGSCPINQDLVLAEWRRARESLGAAEPLASEEYYADAVSRAYYVILHAAKAALYVHDVTANTHAAVRRMFSLHLIKSGALEKKWAAYVSKSLDERLAADYDPEIAVSEKEASRECRQTRQFIRRIRRYLRDTGFKEAELRKRANDG